MAMNKQRRTSNLNNIVRYDTSGNVSLPAGLTVEGLDAGFVKSDANGLFSIDTSAYITLSSLLTGYAVGANADISATDTVLQAFGKLQGQIDNIPSTNIYNSNGFLTGDRIVSSANFTLKFTSTINTGLYNSAIFDNTGATANRVIINHSANTGFGLSIGNSTKWSNAAYYLAGFTNLVYAIYNDQIGGAAGNAIFISGDSNNVSIGGNSDPGFKLNVSGTARVGGQLTVTGQKIVFANTTNYNVINTAATINSEVIAWTLNESNIWSNPGQLVNNAIILKGASSSLAGYGNLNNGNIVGNIIFGYDNRFSDRTGLSGQYIFGSNFNSVGSALVGIGNGSGTIGTGDIQILTGTIGNTNVYLGKVTDGNSQKYDSMLTVYGISGTGTDIVGKNFRIVSGRATGSANSGDIHFMTGVIGSTGTTLQTPTLRARFVGESGNFIIGDGGTSVIPSIADVSSAILNISSSTKGFLQPRMNTAQMNAISSPANGLTIFNTTESLIYLYPNSTDGWMRLLTNKTPMTLTGSSLLMIRNDNEFGYDGAIVIAQNAAKTSGYGTRDIIINSRSTFTNYAGSYNTMIGANAGKDVTTGNGNVMIGLDAGKDVTVNNRSVYIGTHSTGVAGNTRSNIQITAGDQPYTEGTTADMYPTNQSYVFIGGGSYNNDQIQHFYFGAAPLLREPSYPDANRDVYFYATSASQVTNKSGGNFTINAGRGTGTGTPGDIIFATSTATATGTALQSLTNRVWVKGENGNVGIGASPNASYKLDVAGAGRFTAAGNEYDLLVENTSTSAYPATSITIASNAVTNIGTATLKLKTGTAVHNLTTWGAYGVLGLRLSTSGQTSNSDASTLFTQRHADRPVQLLLNYDRGVQVVSTITDESIYIRAQADNNTSKALRIVGTNHTTDKFTVYGDGTTLIGTVDTSGGHKLKVGGTVYATTAAYIDSTTDALFYFQKSGASKWRIGNADVSGANYFQLYDALNDQERIRWNNDATATFTSDITFVGKTNTPVTITSAQPTLLIDASGATNAVNIDLKPSGGQNATIQNTGGSAIEFYTGSTIGIAATITASKNVLIGSSSDGTGRLQVSNTSGDNHLLVWGATAPSIRIDNAVSGSSQRLVIGLSTASSNFITTSVAGDICITTQSANPLLFGSNATEAMRISTAARVLVGKTLDGGQKFQVSGTVNFTGLPTSSSGLASGDLWNNGGVLSIV